MMYSFTRAKIDLFISCSLLKLLMMVELACSITHCAPSKDSLDEIDETFAKCRSYCLAQSLIGDAVEIGLSLAGTFCGAPALLSVLIL